MVGIVVVVAVEAGVGGKVMAMVLMVAAGQALMPTCIPTLYGPSQVPAGPGFFMPPHGPGPAQIVKALGPPMQQPGAKASKQCFNCQQYGHYASYCTMSRGPHPGM